MKHCGIMSYGTPELDDPVWHAKRDEMHGPAQTLLRAVRRRWHVLPHHPQAPAPPLGKRYQKAGLRISSDRDFETVSLSRYGLVTPGVAPNRPREL